MLRPGRPRRLPHIKKPKPSQIPQTPTPENNPPPPTQINQNGTPLKHTPPPTQSKPPPKHTKTNPPPNTPPKLNKTPKPHQNKPNNQPNKNPQKNQIAPCTWPRWAPSPRNFSFASTFVRKIKESTPTFLFFFAISVLVAWPVPPRHIWLLVLRPFVFLASPPPKKCNHFESLFSLY